MRGQAACAAKRARAVEDLGEAQGSAFAVWQRMNWRSVRGGAPAAVAIVQALAVAAAYVVSADSMPATSATTWPGSLETGKP